MVYRQIGEEMQKGLKNIYQQISPTASRDGFGPLAARDHFTEASDQLAEVVQATEAAAMNIMDLVEEQAGKAEEAKSLIAGLKEKFPDAPEIEKLAEINAGLATAFEQIITALSFQDITGQRLRKVTEALANIESSVLDLYLSSGLALHAAATQEHGDAESLQEEARHAVEDYRESGHVKSSLKGPDKNGMGQDAIDELLARLGEKD